MPEVFSGNYLKWMCINVIELNILLVLNRKKNTGIWSLVIYTNNSTTTSVHIKNTGEVKS